MKARSELLRGRLEGRQRRKRESSFGGDGGNGVGKKGEGEDDESRKGREIEMKLLRQKKERLQYAIERLELQTKQRERELRRSMAVVRDDTSP